MRTTRRKRTAPVVIILALIVLLAALAIIFIKKLAKPEPEPDPHAGQVYLYDGLDWVWMTPLEGVPVNELTEDMFTESSGRISYNGTQYAPLCGIDVSEHQHYIDWHSVAQSDIDYAYIRVGRRGYTEGGIFADEYFESNIRGATAENIPVGVYFFSQAVSVQEAIEEADYVLEKIAPYDVSLPVVFDWEKIEGGGARTDGLTQKTRTDCAVAFCETVRAAGYVPGVYFNRNMGYYGYDIGRLTDYELWFSLPESPFPNFYYACDMWQYSFTAKVSGIEGDTDMNLWFVPVVTEEPPTETENSK